jgi:hypothetical protein
MPVNIAIEKIDAEVSLYNFNKKLKSFIRTTNCESVVMKNFLLFDVANQNKLKNLSLNTLLKADDEIDIELVGKSIRHTTRIKVDRQNKPVYSFQLKLIYTAPDGTQKEKPFKANESNIDAETPLIVTDKFFDIAEILQKYIVRKTYQLTHINGITFRFLCDFAKKLSEMKKVVRIDAKDPQSKKSIPIVLKRGGRMFPIAFLSAKFRLKDSKKPDSDENREYQMFLHLIDREMKLPQANIPQLEQEKLQMLFFLGV